MSSTIVIDDTLPYTQAIATSGQTQFDTNWTVDDETDVTVYDRAPSAAADDVTQIVSPNDYTVSFVGVEQFVRVTFLSGRTLGHYITITRFTPFDRENLYTNTNFTPSMLNGDFGRLTLMLQQLQLISYDRTPHYNFDALLSIPRDVILPNLGTKQVWRMNEAVTEIEAVTMLSGEDLASHLPGLGASLIGLENQSHVTNKTVQDLANSPVVASTDTGVWQNGIYLDELTAGVLQTAAGTLSTNASLTSLGAQVIEADVLPYGSGSSVYSTTTLTAFGRSLIDDADATAARVTLGLVIGTNVQAWNANLQSISALGTAADKMLYTTGLNTWAEADITAYSRTLLALANQAAWQAALVIPNGNDYLLKASNLSDLADIPTAVANLGLTIGTDVQAFDATLQSISALGTVADRMIYTTGVDTWAESPITALARTLLDDATQGDMNTTIGSLPISGGTMTGDLFLNGNPTMGSQAATKAYVDSLFASQQQACDWSTTANLAGYTYDNGTLGVGATLTAGSNGAFSTDGGSPSINQRILVQFQTAQAENGVYTLTQVGDAGNPAILTRATDWDTAAEMQAGDIFSVVLGTLYGATQWMFAQTDPITVGTTDLFFTQLVGQGALLRANNLSDLVNAATARQNLGVEIGVDVQAWDATLQSISGLGTAADKMIYTTGIDTWAETDITALARTLLADATDSDMRTTLGLGTMSTQNANAVAITGGTITGLTEFEADNIKIDGNAIQHLGDLNNQIIFGTDTQDYQTGGSSRMDLSDTGFRLGGANSRVTTILDEDNMASDSATALATQQSIKAYVDAGLLPTFTSINIQRFTATGAFSYTPTTGTKFAEFEFVGGGGGSGGTTGAGGQQAVGGAGAAGSYLKILVTGATNLANITGSIGGGGAAGTSGNNPGGNGASTTLDINGGTQWVAAGGNGGSGQAASANVQTGGLPGASNANTLGTNATVIENHQGEPGTWGFTNGASFGGVAAKGGSSKLGSGGVHNQAGIGNGGGAGGYDNFTGSNSVGFAGGGGICIVTEFIHA